MNCGTDFYMGAASILLGMSIMLIKPKQVKLRGGRIAYNFWQEYLQQIGQEPSSEGFQDMPGF